MIPPLPSSIRRLKRIAPLQLGKISGILYAGMGLLVMPFFLLMGAFASQVPGSQRGGMLLISGGMALLAPVMYGVMGFLIGVIGAWLYNLTAKWIGGIEVEVE